MAWYDILLILLFITGVLIMVFSPIHNKKSTFWGLLLMVVALVIKAFFWFESLI
ncbi:MAG: hypothetical protein NTW17_02825 [Candidatus Pacearchaeota archaeon]|nr:hypothetical protein [Candidatus Pacearchaeota archaeon]